MCTYIYIYIHIHIYTQMCVCVCVYIYIYICICLFIYLSESSRGERCEGSRPYLPRRCIFGPSGTDRSPPHTRPAIRYCELSELFSAPERCTRGGAQTLRSKPFAKCFRAMCLISDMLFKHGYRIRTPACAPLRQP